MWSSNIAYTMKCRIPGKFFYVFKTICPTAVTWLTDIWKFYVLIFSIHFFKLNTVCPDFILHRNGGWGHFKTRSFYTTKTKNIHDMLDHEVLEKHFFLNPSVCLNLQLPRLKRRQIRNIFLLTFFTFSSHIRKLVENQSQKVHLSTWGKVHTLPWWEWIFAQFKIVCFFLIAI